MLTFQTLHNDLKQCDWYCTAPHPLGYGNSGKRWKQGELDKDCQTLFKMPSMVAHIFNPSFQIVEASGLEFVASLIKSQEKQVLVVNKTIKIRKLVKISLNKGNMF